MWIMTLADKTQPETPTYAEDRDPTRARAAVKVDDFADLFPILTGWAMICGPDITAYAIAAHSLPEDVSAAAVAAAWWDTADMIRLDRMPGGYVRVADYRTEAPPNGRAPYADPDPLGPAPAALPGT